MATITWILIGALIGWNFPQPTWAKTLQSWGMTKVSSIFAKK